jgi:hypothetical protein
MTASLRGLPACNTETCGLSRTAYRHLWNTTGMGNITPPFNSSWTRPRSREYTDRRGRKSERLRGVVGALGQGGVFVAADPV